MPNGLSILILLVAALAAILAGMAVFSNSRPPDSRVNQVMDDLDEVKAAVNQLQKSVLQIERKMDKDQKDSRAELKDLLERVADRIDKRLQETGG
jgi:beta-lactam-binding protein with PASTA domain